MRDEVPELATELSQLLEREGETRLATDVQNLAIFDRVDHSHGSDFYTAPRSDAPWGSNHRTLALLPGALHIDVVGGQIVMVEVLRRRSRVPGADTIRA
jgi:hypothetical protein